jgi:hypothetical protein
MLTLLSPTPLSPLASPAPRNSTTPTTQRTDLLQPSPLPSRALASQHPTDSNLLRRPSLSLSTASCPRTLGRGNTGLRLNTSSTTPTDTNTYQNTYDGLPCGSSAPSTPKHRGMTETVLPYSRSLHLRSALKNGPIPSFHAFVVPRKKTVSFSNTPEEIHTAVYSLRHSDILTQSPSPRLPLASPRKHALSPSSPDDRAYTLASCRQVDGDHEGPEAKTPVAGRGKRVREWVWTLGESDETSAPMSNTPGDGATGADDAQ